MTGRSGRGQARGEEGTRCYKLIKAEDQQKTQIGGMKISEELRTNGLTDGRGRVGVGGGQTDGRTSGRTDGRTDGQAGGQEGRIDGHQVHQIQTINSDELAALLWVQRHRTAIVAHSWRQICRRDKLSTIFTKIGVQKSVFARRLIGLDRFT